MLHQGHKKNCVTARTKQADCCDTKLLRNFLSPTDRTGLRYRKVVLLFLYRGLYNHTMIANRQTLQLLTNKKLITSANEKIVLSLLQNVLTCVQELCKLSRQWS